jgi:hypothetical protein
MRPCSSTRRGGVFDSALNEGPLAVELDALLNGLAGLALADVMARVLAGCGVDCLVCDDGQHAGDDVGRPATGPDRVLELVTGRRLPGR